MYFEVLAETGEMVHHPTHQVDVRHEDRRVPLLEKLTQALQALLELLALSGTHLLGQLVHGLRCLALVGSHFHGLYEKLQRRFLQDDGRVRSLRLS